MAALITANRDAFARVLGEAPRADTVQAKLEGVLARM